MLHVLRRTLTVGVAVWPQLVALYLLGWVLRYGAIKLAAVAAASYGSIWGMLLLPLGVLARLGSYIAMFLTLRASLPAFNRIDDGSGESATRTGRAGEIFAVAIAPFFAFYAAWKFLHEDFVLFGQWALENRIADIFQQAAHATDPTRLSTKPSVLDIGTGPLVITIIVVAFVGRLILKRAADRLPGWTAVLAVYLEALWVFLAVSSVANVLFDIPGWLASRRIVVWLDAERAQLLSHLRPLEIAYDAASYALTQLAAVIMLPIAWLVLAGILYSRALSVSEERRRSLLIGTKAAERIKRLHAARERRWQSLNPTVRRRFGELLDDVLSRFRPIVDAGRLILHAGVLPMSIYILAYTVLTGAPDWLWRATALALGPHPLQWWTGIDEGLSFVTIAVTEPLRICLVAAAYDFCLERLHEKEQHESESQPDEAR